MVMRSPWEEAPLRQREKDFAVAARGAALKLRDEINRYLGAT